MCFHVFISCFVPRPNDPNSKAFNRRLPNSPPPQITTSPLLAPPPPYVPHSIRLLRRIETFTRRFPTAKNLRHFPKRPFLTVPLKSLSTGISRIKVRFGDELSSRSMSTTSSSRAVEQVSNLLSGKNDDHGGVIVEMSTEPVDPVVFRSLLRASISQWSQEGKKGIWIKLPIELVNLAEPAVKEGFYFHHAEPKYLMLVYWIPETANTLPANATHRVGIGAFVMNEKKEVLVVQEKCGILRGTGVWKFPTGVVEEGEDICDAAVREVKEETGIDSKFVEILGFRQSHKSFFEKSDLFFICLLQPLSFDIQPQESEIEAAQWMPFEEYTAQRFVQQTYFLKYISEVCIEKIEGKYSGFSPVPTTSSFSTAESYLYLNSNFLNSP